jgi:hypothetical protein
MRAKPPTAFSATAGDCDAVVAGDWLCDWVVDVVAPEVVGVVVVVGQFVCAPAVPPDTTRAAPASTATPNARRRYSEVFNLTLPFRCRLVARQINARRVHRNLVGFLLRT